MRVIAVSVDPAGDTLRRGAEVPRRAPVRGLRPLRHGRPPRPRGGLGRLAGLDARPEDDPEAIEHSSLIYGVTAGGELATAYPVGFEAESIASDLPLLARS